VDPRRRKITVLAFEVAVDDLRANVVRNGMPAMLRWRRGLDRWGEEQDHQEPRMAGSLGAWVMSRGMV